MWSDAARQASLQIRSGRSGGGTSPVPGGGQMRNLPPAATAGQQVARAMQIAGQIRSMQNATRGQVEAQRAKAIAAAHQAGTDAVPRNMAQSAARNLNVPYNPPNFGGDRTSPPFRLSRDYADTVADQGRSAGVRDRLTAKYGSYTFS